MNKLQLLNVSRGIGVLVLVTCTGLAFAEGHELSDEELDEVVAGTVDESLHEELLRFSYVGPAGARHEAEIDGTLSVSGGPLANVPTGLLVIDNGAQRDLSALVNLNAVNSQVNVLLNLNITINSTVGEIRQINIQSR
jgi:hypothetical protein